MSRVSAAPSPASSTAPMSWPVISSPQVAALTKGEGDWPTCARHSPPPILSAMRASRVAPSGMRSSASARHIRATPSWLERAYSRISPCTSPASAARASASIRLRASARASRRDRRRQLGRPQQARQTFRLGRAVDGVDRGAPAVMADESRRRRRRRARPPRRLRAAPSLADESLLAAMRTPPTRRCAAEKLAWIAAPLKETASRGLGRRAAERGRRALTDIRAARSLFDCCTAAYLLV